MKNQKIIVSELDFYAFAKFYQYMVEKTGNKFPVSIVTDKNNERSIIILSTEKTSAFPYPTVLRISPEKNPILNTEDFSQELMDISIFSADKEIKFSVEKIKFDDDTFICNLLFILEPGRSEKTADLDEEIYKKDLLIKTYKLVDAYINGYVRDWLSVERQVESNLQSIGLPNIEPFYN